MVKDHYSLKIKNFIILYLLKWKLIFQKKKCIQNCKKPFQRYIKKFIDKIKNSEKIQSHRERVKIQMIIDENEIKEVEKKKLK